MLNFQTRSIHDISNVNTLVRGIYFSFFKSFSVELELFLYLTPLIYLPSPRRGEGLTWLANLERLNWDDA